MNDLLSSVGPEARALLHLCRPEARAGGGAPQVEAVSPFTDDLDWTMLFRLACAEQAVGVVQAAIRQFRPTKLPKREQLAFERLGAVAEFRQGRLAHYIQSVAEVLADLPFLLIKGASLALTHYGSIDDRPMCDIDLIVPRADAASANRRMLDAGWESDPETAHRLRRHHHLPTLTDPERVGVKLEIHTRLFRRSAPFLLTEEDVFGRHLRVPGAAGSVPVPSPEDQLLHACLNFAWSNRLVRNGWVALRDVNRLAVRELDWTRFAAAARACLGGSCAYWTLRLSRDLTGTAVPPDVLDRLASPASSRWSEMAARHFAGRLFTGVPEALAAMDKLMWALAIRPRTSGLGNARPWAPSSGWSHLRRLPGRLRRFGGWARYARGVFSPSPR